MNLNKHKKEWLWALAAIVVIVGAVSYYGVKEIAAIPPVVWSNIKEAVKPGSKNQATDNSIKGIIARLPETSTFNSYFAASGVPAQLGNGPYTVFVPVNSAFAALPSGTVSGLSGAARTRLLQYHVVSGKQLDTDAVMSGSYQALSKDMLNFNVNLQTGVSYVNSGRIISQHKATNGVVYTVSSVLIPPQQ